MRLKLCSAVPFVTPYLCLVAIHWHGGHIHQHESRCNLFSNSANPSLSLSAGDQRLDAATALQRKKWGKKKERLKEGRKEDPPRSAFLRLPLEIIAQRVRLTKRSMVRNRGLIVAKLKLCRPCGSHLPKHIDYRRKLVGTNFTFCGGLTIGHRVY